MGASLPPQRRSGHLAPAAQRDDFELATGALESGEIAGYVEPCPEEALLSEEEAAAEMARHLEERGFSFTPWSIEALALD